MKRNTIIKLGLIIILTAFFVLVDIPNGLNKIGIKADPRLKKGLDLIGGTHIAYEADMSQIPVENRDEAIVSLKDNIDRRVNALGVAEPIVQSRKISDQYGLVVELPGIKDVDQALSIIGQVAQLQFKEGGGTTTIEGGGEISGQELEQLQSQGGQWQNTQLSGRHLKKAEVQFDQQQGSPQISIEFNSDGAQIFSDLTKKNLQKPIAIFLDEALISAPTVQSEITDGKAVITGDFSIAEAKNLAIQLNAGALPVPIKVVEQRDVGATLGQDVIKKGLIAGVIGIILVMIFMILYYKLSGLLSVLALGIYTILVFGIFKISSLTPWGITLTLPGLAGFILSIGIAVDANILIFERTKEELRSEKGLITSIENGFQRAWLSIRDSNLSTLIICLILFWLGVGSIKGFALTLGIGILISMFSAITVTKTLLEVVAAGKIKKKIKIFI